MNKTIDIIGSGIIGLLTAYELCKHNKLIRLFERNWCSKESSWAGGGICSPLQPWRASHALNELVFASRDYYRNLAQELLDKTGIDIELLESGMLVCSEESVPSAWSQQDNRVHSLANISVSNFLKQKVNHAGQAFWLPNVCQIRNSKLMAALRLWAQACPQITIVEDEVTDFKVKEMQLSHIVTKNKVYSSETAVVTAGAWTGQLLKPFHYNVVYPIKGEMLAIKAKNNCLTKIIVTDTVYFVPRQDGLILIGSSLENSGFDKSISISTKEDLLVKAHHILPELPIDKVLHHWAGLRPGAKMIYIGQLPSVHGLYAASGHFRCGLTTAPATAVLLRQMLLEQETSLNINDYAWQKEYE